MGDLAVEGRPFTQQPSPSSSTADADSFSIGQERWAAAEIVSGGILGKVRPTAVSEERRRAVIDYVQRLVRRSLACEVFPYGSVPLKTYLPDGDIDLTAFGGPMMEDALASDLVSVLEEEGKNKGAEFIVKDVQLIRAEVKLVKCIIQNIVVDISFNQIGGLCTLCFLEQVDHLIGKDHLFKRSIILIKAWCYYESRILGAFHGLISTYALETLVLYIFHLFHSRLDGPLAVLYRFLDYFSKFDWEKCCISLNGPIRISSLPEIVAEALENGGSDLLLSNDFLIHCAVTFSVPSREVGTNSQTFVLKHLNIVDPLKETNNLGRSVSKGNFYRIRSAFAYGFRKLGRILVQSDCKNIADELCKFFSNTLDRHGSGQRSDVRDLNPLAGHTGFCSAFAPSDINSSHLENLNYRLKSCDLTSTSGDCQVCPCNVGDRNQECTTDAYQSKLASGTDWCVEGNAVDNQLLVDAMELASSIHEDLKFPNHFHSFSHLGTDRSVADMPFYTPHVHFTGSMCNGEVRRGNPEGKQDGIDSKYFFGLKQKSSKERKCLEKNHSIYKHDVLIPSASGDVSMASQILASSNCSHHIKHDWPSAICARSMQYFHSLLNDLGGDFNYYFSCLQYGRWCCEYSSNMLTFTAPNSPPSSLYVTYSLDAVQQPIQVKANGFLYGSANGIFPSQAFYPAKPLSVPSLSFGLEEILKPRGTGTYFPNMNQSAKSYRSSSTWKGRSQALTRSPRTTNGKNAPPFTESYAHHRNSHELLQESLDAVDSTVINLLSSSHGRGEHPSAGKNYLVSHSEGAAATGIGSVEDVPPPRASMSDQSRQRRHSHTSSPVPHSALASPTLRSHQSIPLSSRDHV
ncbi:unnamed protein product [Cuscuta campestris]|uniref:Polymerase nucleotidyl transferase domain-containing protein n=1 Tax=Cuscuta campestris TaxID=132261 RepID=A0A484L0T8_9ASTE|nr:unnamed protein product [Cuscuta campestris]